MIYIDTGYTSVYKNLAAEYYFATEKRFSDMTFILWHVRPTIVIGKFQNALEEIDKRYLEEKGIDLVRRMSGGGTIYADLGNWMYCFVDGEAGREISFEKYITPIVEAVRDLGVPAEFGGRNDLLIGGRKFSGTAQYKLKDVTVHHGTLMFDVDIAEMVRSATVDAEKITSKSIRSVRDRVTNIKEHLSVEMDADGFKEHLAKYVLRGGEQYFITEEDDRRIAQIAAEHFEGFENIYGRAPKFNIVRTGRVPGGRMTFDIDVQKGRIADAAVHGDFFASVNADELIAAIKGAEYSREGVLRAIKASGIEQNIYRISAEEMADIIAD